MEYIYIYIHTLISLQLGHTAEYYRKHQDEFSHKSILRDFGAADDATEDILTDKGS